MRLWAVNMEERGRKSGNRMAATPQLPLGEAPLLPACGGQSAPRPRPPRENPEPGHAQVSFWVTIPISALHEPLKPTQHKKIVVSATIQVRNSLRRKLEKKFGRLFFHR
jgi:hypothetical protein